MEIEEVSTTNETTPLLSNPNPDPSQTHQPKPQRRVRFVETKDPETTTNETTPLLSNSNSDPARNERSKDPRHVRFAEKEDPEVEVHLYRKGKGPIDVFKSSLGGYDQDQLEVRDILHKYGLKSVYAFSPQSGRGVPIRFHSLNGRSILTYNHGSVIHIDGEPQDSLIKPITKILVGVAVITILIVLTMKETPEWAKKLDISGGRVPSWVLACVVIVFTRMRKRTRDFLEKRRR